MFNSLMYCISCNNSGSTETERQQMQQHTTHPTLKKLIHQHATRTRVVWTDQSVYNASAKLADIRVGNLTKMHIRN